MRVWLYAIVRDEAPIMPYFLRHYTPWVDKLIFYDGGSIDGTRGMIKACGKAELRDWPGSDGIVDDEFMDFANEKWKEARGHADWVVWVDADEFLYHPNMTGLLQSYLDEGVTLPRITGYTMASKAFPVTTGQIYDEVKTGFPDPAWGKSAIFRQDIAWTVGRHSVDCSKFTPVFSRHADILLLHYRALGPDYIRHRHLRNWARVPERCRQKNLGTNCDPAYTDHHSIEWLIAKTNEEHPNIV